MQQLPSQKSSGHRARKRFGQNFLVSESVIDRILRAVNARENDHIIEIGPGLGALTEPLAQSGAQLTAIELDRDLAERIEAKFSANPRFRLICQDALKVDFSEIYGSDQPLRVIGNLPYNISTPLIFHLLGYAGQIIDMHFMLQKEVVERMAAQPGTSDYGRLSVMLQYMCDVESIIHVPPGSFDPAPRVQSAVVRLSPRQPKTEARSTVYLDRIVRSAFNNRRKTLRNSLKNELTAEQIETQGIDPGLRAENLSVNSYVKLANCLYDLEISRPAPAMAFNGPCPPTTMTADEFPKH